MSDKKTEKKPLVPRLRFPEFRDSGEWETKCLSELTEIITDRAGKKKLTLLSVTSGVGLIPQIEKFGREIAGAQYKNYYVIKKNDFAYNKSATKEYPQGYISLYDGISEGAVPNSIFTCFRVQTQASIPYYLSYLFENNLHGKWIKRFITIGARAHGSLNIDNNDLLKTPVPLPSGKQTLAEQQKIADCLSSLDELIVSECKNLDSHKAQKKGLMQKLFPCKGETTSHLRFAEFETNDKWESSALHTISDVVRGGSPRPINDFITSTNEGINWLKIGDIDKDSKYVTKTSEKVIPQALSKTRVVHDGDLILSNSMSFGRPYIMRISSCIHDGWLAITKINSKITKEYLYYYVLSPTSQDFFLTNAAGSGVLNLNIDIIKNLQIIFPHKPEQQKIADCLSSLDELIAAQGRKIELLKLQKKGLMQQLFPEVDEVTA